MALRELIDLNAVMDNIPTIMGLDLTRKGDKWQGGYYMDRSKHPYRRDKLKVWIWDYNIWVAEEGGGAMSLQTWLCTHGGAADYKEAYRIMRGNAIPLPYVASEREKVEGRYVPEEVFAEYCKYDLGRCNLFTWMCRLFGQSKTMEAFAKYDVTTDFYGNAVFWVRDMEGRICFDKRIKYKFDGHRDKQFGAMRKFKVADGYSNFAYFGSHLIEEGKPINTTESEKSCLLGYLAYGGVWVSCGGKGNLKDVDDNMILYCDLDCVDEWSQKGGIIAEWWLDPEAQGLGDHADIGDLIVKKKMKGIL